MKVREVFIEYNKKVSFPWSVRKIKKAGFEPTAFLLEFGEKCGKCEDQDTPEGKAIRQMLHDLNLIL